jgi:hypothetical protein
MLRTNGPPTLAGYPPDLARTLLKRAALGSRLPRRSADRGRQTANTDEGHIRPHSLSGRAPLTNGPISMLARIGTIGGAVSDQASEGGCPVRTANGPPLDALRRSDAPWQHRGRPSGSAAGIHHLPSPDVQRKVSSRRELPRSEVAPIADPVRLRGPCFASVTTRGRAQLARSLVARTPGAVSFARLV